ncbi:methyl-accepting chemotaxis protein [Noviherbaspirillum autotrophicum]|uniref:methyl-accepting chemotaxis protein n=1 Tax=Noviherbaspirillum autotrophicum TaxID=709839 RepID=UPI00069426A6|nr:methyl-accepting chemotaxis protein [Noviherbaspirillum autotrophicum]
MRNNQPVTTTEYRIRPDQSLISRTDTKGKITYVNSDFVAVSGFVEEELLGAPHNIVRHPDMPAEAFDDLWQCLKAGQAWTGMVKNRRKNGDYYWVLANATPIWENGRVAGYTSVRTMPTQEQITAADQAYRLFKRGQASGLAVRHGQVVRTGILGGLGALRQLKIGGRINLALVVMSLLMAAVSVAAIVGLRQSNASLAEVYNDRTVPITQIDTIIRLLNRSDIAVLEAIASGSPDDAKEAKRHVEENAKSIDDTWAAYLKTNLTQEEKRLADKFSSDYAQYTKEGLNRATAALGAGNVEDVKKLHASSMKQTFVALRSDVNDLMKLQTQLSQEAAATADARYRSMLAFVIAALGVAIAFSVGAAVYLSRVIVRPLVRAVGLTKQIAACNLANDINVESNDEVGQLYHALNVMQHSLSNIVAGVRRNAEQIAGNASEIAAGNADLSARTESQASSLEETAASMEELTSTVKNNADNSNSARQLIHAARDMAEEGGVAMGRMVQTMDSISTTSKRVTDIIGVIDGIAFQTNILALNAAVEAARAGEQGRGFAVVASEVRTLAQRSAQAAKEIKDLISYSVAQIDTGSAEVVHVQERMEQIVKGVQQVTDLMGEIAAASQEQSSGIGQVNEAVMQMDHVTQQNAALVEQASAAAEEQQRRSRELMQEVAVFKLDAAYQTTSAKGDRAIVQLPRVKRVASAPTPRRLSR